MLKLTMRKRVILSMTLSTIFWVFILSISYNSEFIGVNGLYNSEFLVGYIMSMLVNVVDMSHRKFPDSMIETTYMIFLSPFMLITLFFMWLLFRMFPI